MSCGEERLSYAELNARGNRLGGYLRGWGVGPETRVGLCLERGVELVVAVLGVLKAGGIYVPLDPGYPAERLSYMLADAEVAALITEARHAERVAGYSGPLVRVDADAETIAQCGAENQCASVGPHNGAYVIYTSGSTGRPKGVVVTQANALRLMRSTEAWFGLRRRRKCGRCSTPMPSTFRCGSCGERCCTEAVWWWCRTG